MKQASQNPLPGAADSLQQALHAQVPREIGADELAGLSTLFGSDELRLVAMSTPR